MPTNDSLRKLAEQAKLNIVIKELGKGSYGTCEICRQFKRDPQFQLVLGEHWIYPCGDCFKTIATSFASHLQPQAPGELKWLRLYAQLREKECSCNIAPEQGYNDICDWCALHPEGNWDEVERALKASGLSTDEPFAKYEPQATIAAILDSWSDCSCEENAVSVPKHLIEALKSEPQAGTAGKFTCDHGILHGPGLPPCPRCCSIYHRAEAAAKPEGTGS